METSFIELRCKQVINVVDGRTLGHITDMILDIHTARILGLVVPGNKSFFNLFRNNDDLFIPYCNICKIGEDTILVELTNLALPRKTRRARIFNKAENYVQVNKKEEPKETAEESITLKEYNFTNEG